MSEPEGTLRQTVQRGRRKGRAERESLSTGMTISPWPGRSTEAALDNIRAGQSCCATVCVCLGRRLFDTIAASALGAAKRLIRLFKKRVKVKT